MINHALRSVLGEGNSLPQNLAAALIGCSSIPELRSLAPLPVDAQRLIDNAVVKVGRERLVIVDDLLNANLTYPLPDPLSVMELYWESEIEAGHAIRTMLPDARGERQIGQRTGHRVPIYITMDDFSFNIRTLRASERVGAPLDTTAVESATRNVNEATEDAVWNGFSDQSGNLIKVAGNSAVGILNAPDVATQAYVDGESWAVAGHSGEDIVADVLAMIDQAVADKFYGPFNFYMPLNYASKLNQDFKSATSGTILERLLAIKTDGGRGINFRPVAQLPANRTALVQMTSDVIDLVVGQTPTEVSWSSPDGFRYYAVIMAVIVQRLKNAGKGIVLGGLTA